MERNQFKFGIPIIMLLVVITLIGTVSAAQCLESIQEASISCGSGNLDCNFGVGTPLTNISVIYKPLIQDVDIRNVIILLCKDETCSGTNRLDQITTIPNEEGNLFVSRSNCPDLNCLDNSLITKSGTYYIKAIIDPKNTQNNPNGLNKEVIKPIKIKKKLVVLLNCPLEGFINREMNCDYKVRDSDTNALVSAINPKGEVFQGTTKLNSVTTGDKIIFTSNTVGSVDISLEVDKIDYLMGEGRSTIEIKHPVNEQAFNIDGKDFFKEISNAGLSTGTHELEMVVTKSGLDFKVNNIKAKIITPSGKEDELTFNKLNDNTFRTTYNFFQGGSTYSFKGEIFPEDATEDSILFEYAILTVGEVVSAPTQSNLLIIVLGAVGAFVLAIIVIFVLLRVFRRR